MLMDPADAPASCWPCGCLTCFSGLRRRERNFTFLRCIPVFDLVLKNGSNINERNWLQLLFYFLVLMGMFTAVIGIGFFKAVFHVLDWSFLLLLFDGNVCNWIPTVIWPQKHWFWVFLLQDDFLRCLLICMDWNLQEMLNFFSILTTSIFFDV